MSTSVDRLVEASGSSGPGHFARRAARLLRGTVAIFAFLAAWEILPRLGLVDTTFLPPFSTALSAFVEMARSGELVEHLAASAGRAFSGLILAVAVGVPLGLVIGWYRS
ncbi:MAG: ABC transporter permease, partial [Bradyrhizobium sp.]|nr:ABC transporter permease [Bradyrhizobium sp.]